MNAEKNTTRKRAEKVVEEEEEIQKKTFRKWSSIHDSHSHTYKIQLIHSLSPQVIIFIVSQFKRQKTWSNFVHFLRFA